LHDDRLGSVELVTSSTGSVEHSQQFGVFGAVAGGAQPGGATGVKRGFTGHEHDADFGLINMRGRIYDPMIARFLTADPLAGDGQGLNRYSYVRNNPTNFIDPSGFDPTASATTDPTTGMQTYDFSPQVIEGRFSEPPWQVSGEGGGWGGEAAPPHVLMLSARLDVTYGPAGSGQNDPASTDYAPSAENEQVPFTWLGQYAPTQAQRNNAERQAHGDILRNRGHLQGVYLANGGDPGVREQVMREQLVWTQMRDRWIDGVMVMSSAAGPLWAGLRGAAVGVGAVEAAGAGTQALPAGRQISAAWGASTYRHGGLMTGMEHIMYRHSAGSGFANVSRFAEGTTARNVVDYVDAALRYGTVTRTGAGAFRLEYNLGRAIGTNIAGESASSLRVFINNGVIQTAFPF
jgi:RHS repeat-associated protein